MTIPKEVLVRFGLQKGAKVFIRETADGILVTPFDQDFEDAMAAFRRGAARYRNAMRELAKR